MSEIIDSALFKQTLVEPYQQGANKLSMIVGYASPAMLLHHLQELFSDKLPALETYPIEVELVVGMYARYGVPRSTHAGFHKLLGKIGHPSNVSVRYAVGQREFHSKVYVWSDASGPVRAYTGSANYTQIAFGISGTGTRSEVLVETDPVVALEHFRLARINSIDITDRSLSSQIRLVADHHSAQPSQGTVSTLGGVSKSSRLMGDAETASLTLLHTRTGEPHLVGGLNHGQRAGRNPSEAYIPVNATLRNGSFFPPKEAVLQTITDDGRVMFLKRGGDGGGKNLMSHPDTSELGSYFRERLAVAPDARVELSDLQRYGRTDVLFQRIDDDSYFMDFS